LSLYKELVYRGTDAENDNGAYSQVNDPTQKPIFFDETHKRWGIISPLFLIAGLISLLSAIWFAISILHSPRLPVVTLGRAASSLGLAPALPADHQDMALRPAGIAARPATDIHVRARQRFVLSRDLALQETKKRLTEAIALSSVSLPIPAAAIAPGHVAGPVRAAFYENVDKPALDSLTHHVGQITHLLPVWLQLEANSNGVFSTADFSDPNAALTDEAYSATNDDTAVAAARAHGVAILPVLQNFNSGLSNGSGGFDFNRLHALLSSPAHRTAVIAQLRHFVRQGHYQGINIDFETDRADDLAGMTAFMTELATAFHPSGLLVTQDVQTDSAAYNLPVLAKVDDFLVPMLYDQHSDGDTPGPISGQDWFHGQLKSFLAKVPANRVVLGLGNYGYNWTVGTQSASDLTFQEAAQLAQENHQPQSGDGVIKTDPTSLNPYFTYSDDPTTPGGKEVTHQVWLQDATTVWNQMSAARPYHTLGAALWELGSEDPSLWKFYGKETDATLRSFDPQDLAQVTYNYFGTQFDGKGDVLDVVQQPTPGLRSLTVDPISRLVTAETFEKYPSQFVIRRRGLVNEHDGELYGKNTSKAIALTFDDGPDPQWTPAILDILEHYHVPATFFVVGMNAEAHPGLLAREWNDGMEIGNHSYTHPEMDRIKPLQTRLELDATQRIIQSVTGHSTTLFRAPNRADNEPTSEEDFAPVWQADKMGYIFIGESNDPNDWKVGIKADEIVKRVLGYVDDPKRNDGNAVLLHDAGGETRAETVKALPLIIEGLQKRGFHFVPVSALVGKPKSVLFPAVGGWTVAFDRLMFEFSYWIGSIFTLLFLLAIVLGISRIVFMGILANMQAKQEAQRVYDPTFAPAVSVIIAAYNEAKVVNRTIATLLASDYPDLDILVVDDGSKDDTAGVVLAAYGDNPRVTVIIKPNGGKASALNLGIKQCRGDIIVALDADTVFAADTVHKLVRHFADPAIGAVSGNVKVGNRNNPLTIWQAVEYITSQNFDRRAFDLLNCITVVPGAVGAWRKDAVILAGMYSSQTLAEDTDLTFKIRKLGYRIVTDNAALAYTEAPDNLRDLAKQRFRWAFGTLQCLWKHRGVLGNPRYGAFGMIAMPSLWVYQIGFQAIAPVVDLTIAWSLFYSHVIAPGTNGKNADMLLGYWALFSAIELLGAWIAFRLDHEDKKLLVWLLLQRFVYRQLMYYVIVKSLVVAVRGSLVGWGKFERKGTVQQPGVPISGKPAGTDTSAAGTEAVAAPD